MNAYFPCEPVHEQKIKLKKKAFSGKMMQVCDRLS